LAPADAFAWFADAPSTLPDLLGACVVAELPDAVVWAPETPLCVDADVEIEGLVFAVTDPLLLSPDPLVVLFVVWPRPLLDVVTPTATETLS
jgi:hypothetical protein